MTDPTQYSKDIDKYEAGLVAGIEGMKRLMDEGYLSYMACQDVWTEMLNGLYGND